MVAVAAIGLLLGATISIRRYHVLLHTYLERAAFHEAWKAKLFATPESPRSWESRWSDQRIGVKGPNPWPDEPPFVPAISDFHDRMIAKRRYAADHPWCEVEPDPVEDGP